MKTKLFQKGLQKTPIVRVILFVAVAGILLLLSQKIFDFSGILFAQSPQAELSFIPVTQTIYVKNQGPSRDTQGIRIVEDRNQTDDDPTPTTAPTSEPTITSEPVLTPELTLTPVEPTSEPSLTPSEPTLTPTPTNAPPRKTTADMALILDPHESKVAFVHLVVTFNQNFVTLSQIQTSLLLRKSSQNGETILYISPIAEANRTGRMTLTVALDEKDADSPPQKTFQLATLTFAAKHPGSARIAVDRDVSQIVTLDGSEMAITAELGRILVGDSNIPTESILPSVSQRETYITSDSSKIYDLNGDGICSILDLVEVIKDYRTSGENVTSDINNDTIVNFDDVSGIISCLGNRLE